MRKTKIVCTIGPACEDEKVLESLWNETVNSTDVLFYMAKKAAKQTFNLKKGDEIVITGGMVNGVKDNTNLIKREVI
jgi:pyruvate kinase